MSWFKKNIQFRKKGKQYVYEVYKILDMLRIVLSKINSPMAKLIRSLTKLYTAPCNRIRTKSLPKVVTSQISYAMEKKIIHTCMCS